jgi:hypothetical protein
LSEVLTDRERSSTISKIPPAGARMGEETKAAEQISPETEREAAQKS